MVKGDTTFGDKLYTVLKKKSNIYKQPKGPKLGVNEDDWKEPET